MTVKKEKTSLPQRNAPPTAGQKTQRGVIAVAFLFVVGIVVVSIVLARTIPDDIEQSGAAVGLTAFGVFFAAGAIGASLGFLSGFPAHGTSTRPAPISPAQTPHPQQPPSRRRRTTSRTRT